MKRYRVKLEIRGYAYVTVVADDATEAEDFARETFCDGSGELDYVSDCKVASVKEVE